MHFSYIQTASLISRKTKDNFNSVSIPDNRRGNLVADDGQTDISNYKVDL